MKKFNLILAIVVLVVIAIACDYIDYTTHRYIWDIPALLCLFLAGICGGKLTNMFGQGNKFR